MGGVTVDCVDLSYHVEQNGLKKCLLSQVSFSVNPGDMCALIGPSGAGIDFIMTV